ncbi:hypothetical protein NEMIN01_0185 [Nematocida minor]|uniref:uncharacterized protein n=1 Tax=Nematocida minor TaxID=1912983 RepID=UPI002220E1DB|nr:uncharacterized protein NEMIN01_0081 [Nematocida minor]XP_051332087.1 uncharacterized protein NEMIN01_0185 [Nematocida minor]KAI5188817.1 hypothetical protein NEMIN01_0081 [Nematocida minor]KAI5188921.1 hypothetical protein NEMIN01_0185 [Nematocida minor]
MLPYSLNKDTCIDVLSVILILCFSMSDSDWEFLRRPSKIEEPPKKETVPVKVVFGGTEKDYDLLANETFEEIYKEYESRFKMALVLEHNAAPLSRYAKAKILQGKDKRHILKIALPKEPPKKKEKVVYKIRYEKYESIEIERSTEKTVGDLLKTVIAKLPALPNIKKAFFEFDGDVLENSQILDEILLSGDLIDLLRN